MIVPSHLAIIMDGNGRWASRRNRPRVFGHIKGARVARSIITECARLGVKWLTIYAFSTENWKRPAQEVSFLMMLLERYLRKEEARLVRENIRFHCLGDISRLPKFVVDQIHRTLLITEKNTGLQLVFALNYGGRQEIVQAAKELARQVRSGEIRVDEITENSFALTLESSFMPDPDLILRTSGEQRLSNFLTWQSSYSEFYATDILWPDFTIEDLKCAFRDFSARERRFGGVAQLESNASPEF